MTPISRQWLDVAAQVLEVLQIRAYDGTTDLHTTPRSISTGPFHYTDEVDSPKYHRIVIVHACLACLAWTLLAPLGAIILRSSVRGVNLLRLHVCWQLFVVMMYTAAAALGIWLRLQLSSNGAVWRYPHAAIGLIMLIGVFIQPWLGYAHHRIFKRRLDAVNAGHTNKKLGRTIITHLHLWLGRLLITLGIINGGLGIMVTWDRGETLQSTDTSRRAAIAYGVIAATCFLIYAACMFRHERRRAPLIMNVAEAGSSVEQSSTTSDKSVQSLELGRRWSVFLEEMPELNKKDRSRSRGRKSSSNERLKLVSGAQPLAQNPAVSPIEEIKTP